VRRALLVLPAFAALALVPTRAHDQGLDSASLTAAASPQCTPAKLNEPAILPGTGLAVSPQADSYDASPQTQISLLGAAPADLSDVRVSGSESGSHSGRLLSYSQGDGASFVPAKPFLSGETVTVRGRVTVGSARRTFAFRFVVARPDGSLATGAARAAKVDSQEVQHFHTRPELEPPVLDVTENSPGTAPGDLFASPYGGPGPSGPEIFEASGNLVWFDPLAAGVEATNLQVQRLEGEPVLTWWQGRIPPQGFGEGEGIIDNASYERIATVHAGNGYMADLHEFRITPNGSALLTVFDPIYCDLTAAGGPAAGAVTDSILQEVDLKTGLVRREWHGLDHVSLRDSYSSPAGSSAQWPFDFLHVNSIDQLAGGTTLISARNTSALYELDTHTGQVLSEIGGRRSSVTFGPGAATAYQHDATVLPNGMISLFDNGGVPRVHSQSRGLLLAIDPSTGTDAVQEQYEHSSPLSSGSQGSMQGLANGDMFIGWGELPYFSEFSNTGRPLYDAHWHGAFQSYRAYRYEWTGLPLTAPAIATPGEAGGTGGTGGAEAETVYASWNGDTRTSSWRLLAGPSPQTLAPVASAARSGFETAIAAPASEPYVAVQALSASGAVLGTSKTISG
jgi:ABC-type amino acid transport substrate-binding protein